MEENIRLLYSRSFQGEEDNPCWNHAELKLRRHGAARVNLVRRAKKRLMAGGLLSFLLMAGIVIGSGLFGVEKTEALEAQPTKYASIQVQTGDTLWEIAREHLPAGYTSTEAYMQEIIALNNLPSETIEAGNQLLIPVVD